MSKSKRAGVVLAGLMLSAGVASAQSAFPTSSNEVSPTGYVQSAEGMGYSGMGAAQSSVPSAAYEHGPAREVAVSPRANGVRPTMAITTPAFPTAAREHGSSL